MIGIRQGALLSLVVLSLIQPTIVAYYFSTAGPLSLLNAIAADLAAIGLLFALAGSVRRAAWLALPFALVGGAWAWHWLTFNAPPNPALIQQISSVDRAMFFEMAGWVIDQRGSILFLILPLSVGLGAIFYSSGPPLFSGPRRKQLLLASLGLALALLAQRGFGRDKVQRSADWGLSQSYPIALAAFSAEAWCDVSPVFALERRPAVRRESDVSGKETYLLIVGESARADRWHLNGYAAQTTPRLEQWQSIVNFTNARSVSNWTQISVNAIFHQQSGDQLWARGVGRGDGIFAFPSATVFDYFNAAGFSTFYIDNNNPGIKVDVSERMSLRDGADNRLDEAVLGPLRSVLNRTGEKKFIVVHLMGSHLEYGNRYPRGFGATSPSGGQSSLDLSYDNTIRYTDFVLDQIVRLVQEQGGRSVVAYTSDHGDHLSDEPGGTKGHGLRDISRFDTEVPLFFWLGGNVATDWLTRLQANQDKHISNHAIGTTLIDMAGLRSTSISLADSLIRPQEDRSYLRATNFKRYYSCAKKGNCIPERNDDGAGPGETLSCNFSGAIFPQ